jgi:hypothetical protein
MLPSVIGSVGWSNRATCSTPLSSERPQQIVTHPSDEPSDPIQQRQARVGYLAIQVRAVDGQQHHRCQGYPEPPHSASFEVAMPPVKGFARGGHVEAEFSHIAVRHRLELVADAAARRDNHDPFESRTLRRNAITTPLPRRRPMSL